MRPRSLLVFSAVALLLLSGCAPTPEPDPTPSTSESADPATTPTPTPEPIVEPETAFDVTCDDVAAEMAPLVGEVAGEVEAALSSVSMPNWYPGPARHAFSRAGGVACSAGDEERSWEVTILPGAQAVTDGAADRGGYWGEEARCEESGMCFFQVIDGDILVSGQVVDPELTADDAEPIAAALRRLGASATETAKDVELPPSDIVGADCARFLTTDELATELDTEVFLIDTFGGWGIPSEVYQTVNGARICYYASGESEYESQGYLMVTTLPGGAWAFERIEGGSEVDVEGADVALSGTDEFDRPVLDLRVGLDWIRLTTYEGSGVRDLTPVAELIVQNYTVGRPAAP